MNNQLSLIHSRNTWLHFIGGYYKDTDKFLDEAIKSRISRRAPAHMVKGMQFGDRLVLLRYQRKGEVTAFAEAQIVGITLDHEVAKEVGDRLAAEGKAEFHEPSGGASVMERECGSYMILGSWTVTCSLADVMEIALEIAKQKGKTLFVMVNAELTLVYESQIFLQPAPNFTRGFIKPNEQSNYFVTPPTTVTDTTVLAISNYAKA